MTDFTFVWNWIYYICKLNFFWGKKDKGLCWLFFSQVQEDLLHISSLLLLPRNIVVRCIVVLWIQLVDGWILSFPEMMTRTTNSSSNGRIICHQCGAPACLHFLFHVFMRSNVYIAKNTQKGLQFHCSKWFVFHTLNLQWIIISV